MVGAVARSWTVLDPLRMVCLLNSAPSAEPQWLDTSPKPTQALLGSSRPPGSLLCTSEFPGPSQDGPVPGRPRPPPSELQASFHGHALSLAERPEALGPLSSQAFLGFSTAPVGSSLPSREDPGTLLAGSHGAPPPLGALQTATVAVDNGFLPHGFLTVGPGHGGHGGHHSPVLQGQPPLPEKKRASEGDHSFGSVSPSSSGFSSPHSGSTMSIPFPNVLPDFAKPPETAAPPLGTCVSRVGGPSGTREGPQGSHEAWEPAPPSAGPGAAETPTGLGVSRLLAGAPPGPAGSPWHLRLSTRVHPDSRRADICLVSFVRSLGTSVLGE